MSTYTVGQSRKKAGGGWKDHKPYQKEPAWDEGINYFEFHEKFKSVRFIGDYFVAVRHWVNFLPKNSGQVKMFPEWCINFDPYERNEDKKRGCPYCEIYAASKEEGLDALYPQKLFMSNVIDRSAYEEDPKKNPVRIIRFGIKLANQISSLVDLNRHKVDGKMLTFGIEDEDKGCDIYVKQDKKVKGSDQYQATKGEHSPLNPEELDYELVDIEGKFKFKTIEDLRASVQRLNLTDREGTSLPKPKHLKGAAAPVASVSADDFNEEDDEPEFTPAPRKPTDEEAAVAATVKAAKQEVDEERDAATVKAAKKEVDAEKTTPTVSAPAVKASADASLDAMTVSEPMAFVLKKYGLARKLHEGAIVPECYGLHESKMKCFKCPVRGECTELKAKAG